MLIMSKRRTRKQKIKAKVKIFKQPEAIEIGVANNNQTKMIKKELIKTLLITLLMLILLGVAVAWQRHGLGD